MTQPSVADETKAATDAKREPSAEDEPHFRLYDESMSPEFKLLKPTDSPSDGADRKYYTKANIARLEDAAEIYGIEIMPEIDNPGHSKAIVDINPSFGTPNDVASIDVKNANAKAYIKKLMPEVASWFRSGKWHFGGDEVYGTPVADLNAYINDMNTTLKATVGPRLFGIWSGANNLENLNYDIVWFDWTGEEPRANKVSRKVVGYWGLYLVPFDKLYQPGQMPDGHPYTTWGWEMASNGGIPIGREIAVWNDNALTRTYGFEAMNAGIRLGLTAHGQSLWSGVLYGANAKMIPYAGIPLFKTAVSQEQSSYWIKSKYPALSVAQSVSILLETASYRNFNPTGTTIAPVSAAEKAAWALKDPLGWDPLDMAAAYAKAQQMVGN